MLNKKEAKRHCISFSTILCSFSISQISLFSATAMISSKPLLSHSSSIPSMVDGLKPGQRKVIFTCIKRNDKREVKVAQLAGSVAEHSAYHHGKLMRMI